MAAQAFLDMIVKVIESQAPAVVGGARAFLTHLWGGSEVRQSGTASNEQDLVYSGTNTITTTPTALDLRGSLTSRLDGSTINIVELTGVYIKHKGTTTAQRLLVGAGSNPAGLFGAGTHQASVGPGGRFVWEDPIDGLTLGAGSTDTLTLAASAGSFDVDILVLGRSA